MNQRGPRLNQPWVRLNQRGPRLNQRKLGGRGGRPTCRGGDAEN